MPDLATEIAMRFPALASIIGADRVIGLAAISTLVGMDCPGLRSMLSRLADMGFRVVTIIDPGVKYEPGYPVFEAGTLFAGGVCHGVPPCWL